MQAQRKEIQPTAATTVPAKIKKATKQSNPNRKLSFKDKHALETLPGLIETLQQEIATLEKTLSDPSLFGKDPTAFDMASTGLASVTDELAKAEEDWLILEMRREELEAN